MASPSALKEWTTSHTPMTEPRRSPRLSGGGAKSVLTPASVNKVNKPARRSSLMVGGKRSHEPVASPANHGEDELPEEMQGLLSDSPVLKKPRPSDAKRQSRVSFGGVELRKYDKNQKGLTPASAARRSSPEPVQQDPASEVSTVTEVSEASEVSEVSISSNEEGFYSPGKASDDDGDVSEKVPSLKELMDDELTEMQGYTANLTAKLSTGEQTAAVPRLSDLGNLDNTENIQPRTSSIGSVGSTGARESMAPNTDLIAANMASRPSMAPHAMGLADTPTGTGPSLANLVKRAQGELDESQATSSMQDSSSPNTSGDDLDGSMEMTECYGGGIVQTAQSSPARPPAAVSPNLAAASMTTLSVNPPESPNLRKLLREREHERERERAGEHENLAAALPSSPAVASPASEARSRRMSSIGAMIPTNMNVSPIATSDPKPRSSTTPQAMNRRKAGSMLAATEDIAPPSPVSGTAPQVASPAMLRAGSRITMTESGTKPSPKPPQSPCRPSPMQVSPAQTARPMPSFESNEEEASASASAPPLTADEHADEVLGGFEDVEAEEESFQMPDHIPDSQVPSPVAAAQVTRQSAGVNVKKELKRRSMAHAGQLPLMPAPDTTRSSTQVVCDNMKQFMQIADVGFLEDLSVNRRDTLCVRPGRTKAQDYNLAEAIAVSTTTLPELRVTQEACDSLTAMITTSQAEVANAETAAEQNPPALFAELASDTRSEVATVIRGKLKTLKQTCRKQAKLEWYEWFKSIVGLVLQEAEGEIDRLTKEESDLVTRGEQYDACLQKLHEYMLGLGVQPLAGRQLAHIDSELNEANALEKATAESRQETMALEEQVAKLKTECAALQTRKDSLEQSVEDLNLQKGFLMGESNGTVSVEDAARAQQCYLAQLNVEGIVLQTMKRNEIVIDLCKAHRITLAMEDENIAETQLNLFEAEAATSFGEVDDFWRGIVEDSGVESIVAALCGRPRSSIPGELCELGFRLGRCHDLKDEVNSIQRSLKLLVERERSCVTVHVSNLPLNRKLTVSFSDLGYGYPSEEIAVEVNHHCGDITAAAARDVIRGFKSGQYGRLYSMCEALVKLVSPASS